MAM
jgi:hypothetical protein